jgi:ribonuclease HII
MPDFAHETRLMAGAGPCHVIGLDEAGRGPWAGPVTAAAVWLDPRRCPAALLDEIDDSKALNPAARARVFAALHHAATAGGAAIGVGVADVAEIDALNILRASLLAMQRAAADLRRRAGFAPSAALVDGNQVPALPCPAEAVVAGDRLSLSIAAASIVAKVVRDRRMDKLAENYPGYGWEHNRGYGTQVHRAALGRLGVTPEHRRSFRPIRHALGLTI